MGQDTHTHNFASNDAAAADDDDDDDGDCKLRLPVLVYNFTFETTIGLGLLQ